MRRSFGSRHLAYRGKRRYATIMKATVIIPAITSTLFAAVEFGHARMVGSMIQTACQNGARMGRAEGVTTAQVIAKVNLLLNGKVDTTSLSVYVNDASSLELGAGSALTPRELEGMPAVEVAGAGPGELFVVRATIPYNEIALAPMPFMKDVVIDGQAFMRHE